MKILLLIDEVWNDKVHANNVLTNWFQNFDASLAVIYCSPGLPDNPCCDRYFQVTDIEMAKSIINRKPSGRKLSLQTNFDEKKVLSTNKRMYSFLKKISLVAGTPIYFIRDFIWTAGKYNINELESFILDFNPDIVFCPRMFTPKMARLENIIRKIIKVPFVPFVGDDELCLYPSKRSLLYNLRRYFLIKLFIKHKKNYCHYFTLSQKQSTIYRRLFKIDSSVLYKSGDFSNLEILKTRNKIIKLVYAGRLYCNRWKTLCAIGSALELINKNQLRMQLDVYTKDVLSSVQKKAFGNSQCISFKGSITAEDLKQKYLEADIALHVEALEGMNRIKTQFSFSTKIVDLLSSSCALMAICWENHTGLEYLKSESAAFCISTTEKIYPTLLHIVENPSIINRYADKALKCGLRNHKKEVIQANLKKELQKAINSFKFHLYS